MGFLAVTVFSSCQSQTQTFTQPKLLDLSVTIPALISKLKLKVEGSLPALYPVEAALFGTVGDEELLRAGLEAYGYPAYIGAKGSPFGMEGVLSIRDHNAAIGGNHRPPSKVIRSAFRAVKAQGETEPIAKGLSRGFNFPEQPRFADTAFPRLKLAKFETNFSANTQALTQSTLQGYLSGWVAEIEEGYRVNGTWLNLVNPPKEKVWFECPSVALQYPYPRPKTTRVDLSFAPIDLARWKIWQAWTVSQHRTGWFDPEKAIIRRGHDPKLVADERARSPWETVCKRLSLRSEHPALLVLDDGWLPTLVNVSEKESLWPVSPNCTLENYEVFFSTFREERRVSVLTADPEGRPEGEYYLPPRQSLYLALKHHKGPIAVGFPSFGLAGLYADYSHIEAGIIARATNEAVGWSVREWPAVKALSARPVPWLASGGLTEESDYLARYAIDRAHFFSREVMAETLGHPQSVRRVFTSPERNLLSETRRIIYYPAERRVIFARAGASTPRGLGANLPSTVTDYADRVASFLFEDSGLKLETLLADLKFVLKKEPVIRLQLQGTQFFADVPTTAISVPEGGFKNILELPSDEQEELSREIKLAQERLGKRQIKP